MATLEREYDFLAAKANPSELKEGLRHLFLCYVGIEDEDRAMAILEKEYAVLAKARIATWALSRKILGTGFIAS